MAVRCPRCSRINEGRCSCSRSDYDKKRGSSYSRGYDGQWRRVRTEQLKKHPLCQDCLEADRCTVAREVHHIVKISVDPSRRLDPKNLMSLCKPCHTVRTLRGE